MSCKALKAFATALAAAAIATVASTANAKFVGSEFDPPFFIGFGQFFVPDAPSPCLYQGTGFFSVNGGLDPCTGVVLVDAIVNVTDGTNTAVLTLPPPIPSAGAVTGMVLDTNSASLVVGINTGLIPIDCTGALCGGLDWFIQWNSGMTSSGDPLSSLLNSVMLFTQCSECSEPVAFGHIANQVFFTPEPGSLALLFGALGAGWLARRRKNAA